MTKRKLIYVWNYTNWGGAQIYLLGVMRYAKEEWDVLAVLPTRSSPELIDFLKQEGIRCEFIDAEVDVSDAPTIRRKLARQKARILAEIRTLRFLRRYDLRSSIVHLEFAPWQSWILYLALSRIGANVFVNIHNALPPVPLWRELVWKARLRFLSGLSGFHVITSNDDTRKELKGWFTDTFWDKIIVAHTSVDPGEILKVQNAVDKAALRKQHDIPPSDRIVLCVAQFIDRKGRWTFLDAAALVSNMTQHVSFVWVAPSGPNKEEQERIDGYGLGRRFRFIRSSEVGSSRTDILRFFQIADIFVLPSMVEGLPGALLEAMAMGLPVVSTRVNAIPEAVENGKTGILIQPSDPAALAEAIKRLAADRDLRQSLGAAAKDLVLSKFDQRITSDLILNEYKECFGHAS